MPRQPKDLRLDPPIPALHPERDALLAAVRDADPADDLPALVYADWQDEHGQPEHAELIRVMCELGRLKPRAKATKTRHAELSRHVTRLLRTPALEPLREMAYRKQMCRGFDRWLCVSWVLWSADKPFRRRYVGGPPSNLDIPSVVPFDKVAWLAVQIDHDIGTDRSDLLVTTLAAQPWLRRVDRLLLPPYGSKVHVGPGVFSRLAASSHLGGLLTFEPKKNTIAGHEVVRLYAATSAVNLRTLELGQLQYVVTSGDSRRPSRKAFLSAVEQIVSSKKAKKLTSLGGHFFTVDEALAGILLASPLPDSRFQNCQFKKITAKTRARLPAERAVHLGTGVGVIAAAFVP